MRAVITGATRGIGAAVARALAPTHELVLCGRDTDALARLSDALTAPHGVRTLAFDVTDEDAVAAALGDLDAVDVLVAAAGIAGLGRIDAAPLAQWRDAFSVNVVGVVAVTRELLPALRRSGGHVVAINSGAGHVAKPGWAAYAASKFALRAFTDALRQEEPALRVTSVHPGRVDTDMQRRIVADEGGTYDAAAYLRPESVAEAVRAAITATPDAHPTEIVIRPR